jgi:hypothetical protein
MHCDNLRRSWHAAGTDGPERLVSDHCAGRRHALGYTPGDLLAADGQGIARKPLRPSLTDANDCQQTGSSGGIGLGRHDRIGLAVMLAALSGQAVSPTRWFGFALIVLGAAIVAYLGVSPRKGALG